MHDVYRFLIFIDLLNWTVVKYKSNLVLPLALKGVQVKNVDDPSTPDGFNCVKWISNLFPAMLDNPKIFCFLEPSGFRENFQTKT